MIKYELMNIYYYIDTNWLICDHKKKNIYFMHIWDNFGKVIIFTLIYFLPKMSYCIYYDRVAIKLFK